MKKLATLLVLLPVLAIGGTFNLQFAWSPNAPSDQVIAYRLYERVGTTYALVGTTTNTTLVLSNVVTGQHFYSLTASNMSGEGPRSAEVSTPAVPGAPTNLTIQVSAMFQGSTTPFGPWEDVEALGQVPALTQYPFYRAKLFILP